MSYFKCNFKFRLTSYSDGMEIQLFSVYVITIGTKLFLI